MIIIRFGYHMSLASSKPGLSVQAVRALLVRLDGQKITIGIDSCYNSCTCIHEHIEG